MANTNCTHCVHGVRITRKQHEKCEGCRAFVPGPVDAPAPTEARVLALQAPHYLDGIPG